MLQRLAGNLASAAHSAHFSHFFQAQNRVNSYLKEENDAINLLGDHMAEAYANMEGPERQRFWSQLAQTMGRGRSGKTAMGVFLLLGEKVFKEHREQTAKAIADDVYDKKQALTAHIEKFDRREQARKTRTTSLAELVHRHAQKGVDGVKSGVDRHAQTAAGLFNREHAMTGFSL